MEGVWRVYGGGNGGGKVRFLGGAGGSHKRKSVSFADTRRLRNCPFFALAIHT